ncbi:MAG: MOSC domain-containing protein [Bryobacteraceae bacterium]
MRTVGRVASLWRYPVKSMCGLQTAEIFVGFRGICGDRMYAIHNARARPDFPYFTAREQGRMLQYRPRLGYNDETDLEIELPGGKKYGITDPKLLASLQAGLPDRFELALLRSERALTDCSPVSLISTQTVQQLSRELGKVVDQRRFRANLYLYLDLGIGFAEDQFVGRNLKIGSQVILAAVQRDVRCKMITLDPDTFEPDPELMKLVARQHDSCVGIYANVLAEGAIRPGDLIEVLD